MGTLFKRAVSIMEDGYELIMERELNKFCFGNKTLKDERQIAHYLEKRYRFAELYDIEYKPKDLTNGLFVVVSYEESDSSVYLLETKVSDATYEKAQQRLNDSPCNGFIIKLTPTNHAVYGVYSDSRKVFIEVGLSRMEAKKLAFELNQDKSKYTEVDFDTEEDMKF
jgi:hypothetical protein